MPTTKAKTYEERGLTSEKFEEILSEIVMANKGDMLDIPGIYEILSEHYNDAVLEAFDEENPEDEDDEEPEGIDCPTCGGEGRVSGTISYPDSECQDCKGTGRGTINAIALEALFLAVLVAVWRLI